MNWLRLVPAWVWWLSAMAVVAGVQQMRVGEGKYEAASARKELAELASAFQREREAAAVAVIDWQETEQARRRALEGQLQANDKIYYQELINAQANQARLRDRLATSDLRLSVLLATPSGGSGMPATTSTGGVVHGTARGELDPAHAQRVVAITGDGDEGLKALQACQAYVLEVTR